MTSSQSKHDSDCLRRKVEMNFPYLCTCAMTDEQVQVARDLAAAKPATLDEAQTALREVR